MAWLSMSKKKKLTANAAKARLKVTIETDRQYENGYVQRLRQELMQVIQRFDRIDLDQVEIDCTTEDDSDKMVINIILPEDGGSIAYAT